MVTTTALSDTLQHTHDELSGRLAVARTMTTRPEQSRRGCPPIDLFLAGASKHLHAVDAVLLPAVRSRGEDGSDLVRRYLPTARQLEVVLAHVKAHEFGSAWETHFDWGKVWGDVDSAMAAEWDVERHMAEHLAARSTDEELADLATRLERTEARAPTRPHPYLPHTGPGGGLARGLMRLADSFWDAVEGRFVPETEHKPRKRPGLIGQYLLADPRFEETSTEEAGEDSAGAPAGVPEASWRVPRQNARRD